MRGPGGPHPGDQARRGAMRKNVALVGLLALIGVVISSAFAARPAAPRSGVPTPSEQPAAAGEDLIKFLPRSTIVVVVLNLKRTLVIDAIAEAMQELKFKAAYDEFIKMSGIDLMRDVGYIGLGIPASKGAGLFSMSTPGSDPRKFGIIVNLKYDQGRLLGLIKEKAPAAKEETYEGMTIYSNLDGGDTEATPAGRYGMGKLGFQVAFLDASHIVLGNDGQSIKGIIDVYRKKAEPLAKNAEMTALWGRVDKTGLAWSAVSYPPELVKKAVDANPQLKFMAGIRKMTMAIDDKISGLYADIRAFAGTKEQNADFASTLNGLKFLAAMSADQEPALAELLNGVAITSGEDYTRATLTVSHETMGKLWRLAQPRSAVPAPELPGAGAEWTALNNEATDLHDKGNVERAIEVGKKALELAEKNVGPDHPDVALSLNNLAVFYDALGRHAEAEPLFKRSLAIREKASGPDALDVALTLFNFGRHYETRGLHAEAEPLFSRALAIREKVLGPDDPQVAVILDELGYLRHYQGQDAEAESFFRRALAVREKALGRGHALVARSLCSIGIIYNYQGRFAEAEPLFRRALAVAEKASGPNDPDVAMALFSLAGIYMNRGQYAKAEPLLKRSLAATEKSLGPDHPDLADPLGMLAMAYFGQRKFAKAEPLLERSLAIMEKTLGPDDAKIAQVLEALARLYRVTKREKQAEELEARARIRAIRR
jgi:tetratricopeptide (TPR) repeat protein